MTTLQRAALTIVGFASAALGAAPANAQSPTPIAPSGARWSYTDGGKGWSAYTVALGDNGTLAFAEVGAAPSGRALLLSSHGLIPEPAWTARAPSHADSENVHAAAAADRFVSCRLLDVGAAGGLRLAQVVAWRSSSDEPAWSWTFPALHKGAARAAVSRNGARVVVGAHDQATQKVYVAVLDGATGALTATWDFPIGSQLTSFVLSEDGSALYVGSTSLGSLHDVTTGALKAQVVLNAPIPNQDISGDGSVLAVGGFGRVDLWRRQANGNYLRTWQGFWPGSILCHRLDVSEDGSTLALAFGYFDQNLRVRIEVLDLATMQTTLIDERQGGGTFQNLPSRVATSRDGRRIAVGLWGDQAGFVPELLLYERNQNQPVATHDLPGSVLDLSMSPDGERVLVGTKAAHANELVPGGSVALYDFEASDLEMRGVPSRGKSVEFVMHGAPNTSAVLVVTKAASAQPAFLPGVGTLYLRRDQLTFFGMGTTDATGRAVLNWNLPTDLASVGSTWCFQAATTVPRRLTKDWQRFTVLP